MEFYRIQSYTEYDSYTVYLTIDKEDAMSKVKDFDSWYSPRGTCLVEKIDQNIHVLESWNFYDNKLREHRVYGQH